MQLRWKKKDKQSATMVEPERTESRTSQDKSSAAQRFIRNVGDKFSSMVDLSQKVLSQIAKEKEILQGVFLISITENGITKLKYLSGYACVRIETEESEFLPGEGLPGQVAKEGKILNLKAVPEGYVKIRTGLGEASPSSLIIIPIIYENILYGVIELASFHEFTLADEKFFYTISEFIGSQMKIQQGTN